MSSALLIDEFHTTVFVKKSALSPAKNEIQYCNIQPGHSGFAYPKVLLMNLEALFLSAPLAVLSTVVDNVFRMASDAHDRRAARQHLAYLDDRNLSDIGLRREELTWLIQERLRDSVVRFHF